MLPNAADVVAYIKSHDGQPVTLRDLVDAFDVDADHRREFRELLYALVERDEIVQLKSKLYKAKTAPLPERPPWIVEKRPQRRAPDERPPQRKNGKNPLTPQPDPTQLVGVLNHVGGRAMAVVSRDDDVEYLP